jgi:hypothetical protein
MFGTRAGLVVDLTYVVTLIAPLVSLFAFRAAGAGRYELHRKVQLATLAVCFAAVVALEVCIRLAGGSGSLLATAPPQWARAARVFLGVHIVTAVITYLAWLVLAVMSLRRYRGTLPGGFSRSHRRAGWLVFSGLCFTALSATGMYVLAFVA